MSDFTVIPPIVIGDLELIDSNFLVEDPNPAWVAGTYNFGDIRTLNKRRWEVRVASTTAQPGTNSDWADIGPTNLWAAWDDESITQAELNDEIHYQIQVDDLITGITFMNAVGFEVQVVITPNGGGSPVFDETRQLQDLSQIVDWYSWTVEPRDEFSDRESFLNLPLEVGAVIDLYVRNMGGVAKIGLISVGRKRVFAVTEFGVAIGIEDYSRYLFDEFGNLDIIKRGMADTISYPLVVDTNQNARAVRLLKRLAGTPCVWIGAEYRPETIVYGVYQRWSDVIGNGALSTIDLDVKGYVQ